MRNLNPYRKAIVAGLGFVAVLGSQFAGVDGDWVTPLLAALTAAGVFSVANENAV